MSYDPGTPTTDTIRACGANRFAIDSFRGEAATYLVTLGEKPCCDCPHFCNRLAGTGQVCKHVVAVKEYAEKQARAEQFAKYALIAGTLEDGELEWLIEKYRGVTGRGPVLLALLAEQFDRWLLATQEGPSSSLEAILGKAKAWGAARRQPVPTSGLSEEARRAIWA